MKHVHESSNGGSSELIILEEKQNSDIEQNVSGKKRLLPFSIFGDTKSSHKSNCGT